MSIDTDLLQRIVEGALLASAKPLTVQQLAELFEEDERPANDIIRAVLEDIASNCSGRGFELKEIASGYRFQVVQEISAWVGRLWEEKPQKYSRALLETLSLVAYRQPITRGDIEDIRGVAVSTNIIKTLMEREWVRVVGHKDVPGRPAMYATTRRFLDYFNLKNLEDLPSLAEIRDLDSMNQELALEGVDTLDPEVLAAAVNDVNSDHNDTDSEHNEEHIDTVEQVAEASGFELQADEADSPISNIEITDENDISP
jgi:segregation and condensation protein B